MNSCELIPCVFNLFFMVIRHINNNLLNLGSLDPKYLL